MWPAVDSAALQHQGFLILPAGGFLEPSITSLNIEELLPGCFSTLLSSVWMRQRESISNFISHNKHSWQAAWCSLWKEASSSFAGLLEKQNGTKYQIFSEAFKDGKEGKLGRIRPDGARCWKLPSHCRGQCGNYMAGKPGKVQLLLYRGAVCVKKSINQKLSLLT